MVLLDKNKNGWAAILILFLFHGSILAAPFRVFVKPLTSIVFLNSKPLQAFYDRDWIGMVGAETGLVTPVSGLGVYLKLNRYAIHVPEYRSSSIGTSHWYTIGIFKRIDRDPFAVDLKMGLTCHEDELAGPFPEQSRYGFDLGIVLEKKWTKRFSIVVEAGFHEEKCRVPQYMTFAYSRHAGFLAGKEFSTGGILLTAGCSFYLL